MKLASWFHLSGHYGLSHTYIIIIFFLLFVPTVTFESVSYIDFFFWEKLVRFIGFLSSFFPFFLLFVFIPLLTLHAKAVVSKMEKWTYIDTYYYMLAYIMGDEKRLQFLSFLFFGDTGLHGCILGTYVKTSRLELGIVAINVAPTREKADMVYALWLFKIKSLRANTHCVVRTRYCESYFFTKANEDFLQSSSAHSTESFFFLSLFLRQGWTRSPFLFCHTTIIHENRQNKKEKGTLHFYGTSNSPFRVDNYMRLQDENKYSKWTYFYAVI